MKLKHGIILLVLGFCFDFLGALQKILHNSYGDTLLIIGTNKNLINRINGSIYYVLVIVKFLNPIEQLDYIISLLRETI